MTMMPTLMTLAPGNRAMYDALLVAISAIYHLDDAGCTALDIDLRSARAVLQIDRPPKYVRGVLAVRKRAGSVIERRMVAPYHGAQIEWTERASCPSRRAELANA